MLQQVQQMVYDRVRWGGIYDDYWRSALGPRAHSAMGRPAVSAPSRRLTIERSSSITKRTWRVSTSRASVGGVRIGSRPWKPPRAITGSPVRTMMGAASIVVEVDSR